MPLSRDQFGSYAKREVTNYLEPADHPYQTLLQQIVYASLAQQEAPPQNYIKRLEKILYALGRENLLSPVKPITEDLEEGWELGEDGLYYSKRCPWVVYDRNRKKYHSRGNEVYLNVGKDCYFPFPITDEMRDQWHVELTNRNVNHANIPYWEDTLSPYALSSPWLTNVGINDFYDLVSMRNISTTMNFVRDIRYGAFRFHSINYYLFRLKYLSRDVLITEFVHHITGYRYIFRLIMDPSISVEDQGAMRIISRLASRNCNAVIMAPMRTHDNDDEDGYWPFLPTTDYDETLLANFAKYYPVAFRDNLEYSFRDGGNAYFIKMKTPSDYENFASVRNDEIAKSLANAITHINRADKQKPSIIPFPDPVSEDVL